MNHTKGKWSWNMAEDGVATLYGGTEEQPAAIADFWRKPLRLKNNSARDESLRVEQIANVSLCAAGKDMLAALKLFEKQWNACGPNSDFGKYFGNVRDAARAAIAKAEG